MLRLAWGCGQRIDALRQLLSKRNLGTGNTEAGFSSCPFSLHENKAWSVISTTPKSLHRCVMAALERNIGGKRWGSAAGSSSPAEGRVSQPLSPPP